MDRRHLAGAFRLGLTLAVILLLAMQIRDWWNPTTDAVSYFSIARSVWSGRGLTNLGDRRLHFAPGYPLLICPLFLLPHPFLWLSIARCVFALAALVAVYRWVREMLSEYAAVFVTAATACNISFWYYYRTPLSDLPMMLWMFWAALAARRALAARAAAGVTGWCAGAAVLVAAASATRQAALAVGVGAAAVAVHEAVARRVSWRRALLTAAATLLPAALGLAALAYYDGAMAGSDLNQTYVTKLQSALAAPLAQIAVGLHLRVADVGRLLIPGTWSSYARPGQWLDPNMLVDLPLVMLVAAGWWKLACRARDPLLWSMPLYVGYTFCGRMIRARVFSCRSCRCCWFPAGRGCGGFRGAGARSSWGYAWRTCWWRACGGSSRRGGTARNTGATGRRWRRWPKWPPGNVRPSPMGGSPATATCGLSIWWIAAWPR